MSFPAWTHLRVGMRAFLFVALVAAAVFPLTFTLRSTAQTNIKIDPTVKQSGVKRFGINLANQDFYDNGMMLRNLIFRNPGFEGESWTTILHCQVVTSTICQDDNPYTAWPANFMQNATYTFMSGPATGQTGTVTSQDAASYIGNYGVTLHYTPPSIKPNAGDYLQVRTTIPGNAATGFLLLNQSGATVSSDTNPADQAPGTTGKQCLQITGPNHGQSVQVAALFDTTYGRSFIQLNGSFTITFKAKSTGGSNQFLLEVFRGTTPQTNYLNQNVTLTNSWNTYSYTFNAAENGSAVGAVGVYFDFDGNNVLLDDLQLSPNKNTYNTAYRDEVVQTLLTLKPGVLRYMDSAQGMGTTFDNIIKDQFGRQRAGWSTGVTEIDTVPVGLFDFLQLCKAVGAEPYWTMPTATTPTEMTHIMEYMAGSSTTHYGAIRAAQGQAAPWTTVFPTIHMELGNEVWNGGSFSGETMPDPDIFGAYANTVYSAAKATSYYAGNAGKFDFVIGSLQVNEYVTQHELDACPSCDTVAVATYEMSTLSDYSSMEAVFGPMMAFPQFENGPIASSSNTVSNHMYLQSQVASGIGVSDAWGTKNPGQVAVYETNLGLTSGTAPQSVVASANAGIGAGVSQANHMLMMLRDLGIKTQNMFALSEYQNAFYGSSPNAATTVPLWGTVIDMGGPTNLRRPQFLAEQLANAAILPTMLTTKQTGDNPTWNQPLNANQVQLNNVQYIQSYAFTDGTHQSVVVMNLHRTASLPVKFTGGNGPTGDITIQQLTSANITDTNEAAPIVKITTSRASGVNPGTTFSLPPFSMTVFLWPGTSLAGSSTSLAVTPQTATPGQSVSLTASVNSQSGTTPTGTVTFLDGSTTLGSTSLDSNGNASYATSALSIGSHSIAAFYGGDTTLGGSSSSSVNVTISQNIANTTTTLSVSPASTTPGLNVALTVAVSSQSGGAAPTGTVTFKDGGQTLGTGSLNTNGTASLGTSSLPAGSHSIDASYSGDAKHNGSNSNTVTVTINSVTPPGSIPNGTYTLTNRTNLLLDDPGGNTNPSVQMIQFQADGAANQTWDFVSDGNGSYTIQSHTSGLYLADPNRPSNGLTPLVQNNPSHDSWQLWKLVASGADYTIENRASGRAIDYGWGQGIVLWSPGGKNQPWTITSVTPTGSGSQPVPDGVYTITNVFTNTLLDDNGGAIIPGLQILNWPATGGTNQSWRFAFQGDGYYTIQNVASAEFLTSPNSSTSPGIPLVQDPPTNDASQLWQVVPYNGNYVFVNKFSGLLIDYPWEVGIDLWSPNGGSNQLWSIAP